MIPDAAAVRAPFGDDEPSGDDSRNPAPLASDSRREPRLPIEDSEKLLYVSDLSLDLDHEQRPSRFVPCEQIDPAAIGIEGKRHFRCNCPARDLAEPAGDGALKIGVASAEQTIQLATPPASIEVNPNIQHGRDSPKRVNRHGPDVAALNCGDEGLGHSGLSRNVDLPQAPTDTDRAKGRTDSLIRHPRQCVGNRLSARYL